MKKLIVVLSLVASLISLAAPCYAMSPSGWMPGAMAATEAPEEEGDIQPDEWYTMSGEVDANSNDLVMCGGFQSASAEELESYYASHPEERGAISSEELELSAGVPDAETMGGPNSPYWIYTRDRRGYGFYFYGQHYNNTCGAASAQMCLKGVARVNVTEKEAAKGLGIVPSKEKDAIGASMKNLVSYLNSKQSVYTYEASYTRLPSSTLHKNALSAISAGAPVVIGISVDGRKDDWQNYVAKDHVVVAYAIKSDKSQYWVSDPGATLFNNNDWKYYSRTADQVWNAYASRLGYCW